MFIEKWVPLKLEYTKFNGGESEAVGRQSTKESRRSQLGGVVFVAHEY